MIQWSPDTRHRRAGISIPTSRSTASASPTSAARAAHSTAISPCCRTPAELTKPARHELRTLCRGLRSLAMKQAHPGYYAITLGNGIRVELTVAVRAGIARFTFPEGADARVLVNAGSSANSIAATRTRTPHDSRLSETTSRSRPMAAFRAGRAPADSAGPTRTTKSTSRARFDKPCSRALRVAGRCDPTPMHIRPRASTPAPGSISASSTRFCSRSASPLSAKPARANNLEKEIRGWDFDAVHDTARVRRGPQLLDRATVVEGGTPDQRTIFYTGVYHSFLSPNFFSDRGRKLHRLRRQGALPRRQAPACAVRQLLRLGHLSQHRAASGSLRAGARKRHDAVAGQRRGRRAAGIRAGPRPTTSPT